MPVSLLTRWQQPCFVAPGTLRQLACSPAVRQEVYCQVHEPAEQCCSVPLAARGQRSCFLSKLVYTLPTFVASSALFLVLQSHPLPRVALRPAAPIHIRNS